MFASSKPALDILFLLRVRDRLCPLAVDLGLKVSCRDNGPDDVSYIRRYGGYSCHIRDMRRGGRRRQPAS
jgi:hypothetical protein